MARTAMWLLATVSGLLAVANAQLQGWEDGQVNTTMCYWEQLRASVIRDTLYMDGGSLYWKPVMENGTDMGLTKDTNPRGVMFTLNFSQPFDTSANVSALFAQFSKGSSDNSVTNLAPNYYDGALLSNDDEIYLFGGLITHTDTYSDPDSDEGLYYEAYLYGVNRTFSPNLGNYKLPDGMNRYIAYGGAANAPSEYKSWYFSGMHSPTWDDLYTSTTNISHRAVNTSNTLITLDMTTQMFETWTNDTLPDTVKGRANPELVWVPVGEDGILVAIGGVTYPEFANTYHVSSNETASREESPVFMTTIDVYDLSNGTWYKQTTTGGGPGQLARSCAVVAPAVDASSFNIYVYGGYDGLNITGDYNDDVWVLSLPSFAWTLVTAGTTAHARAGHRCVMPYPDQMFVVGGYATQAETEPCVDGGIVQVFNLSSGKWMSSYNPENWASYAVPTAVQAVIGGNGQGSATATQPAATGGWDEAALGNVFATAYTKTINTYYPYEVATATSAATTTTAAAAKRNRVPTFLPPLLGVICGLMAVSLAILGFVIYRKRKLLQRGSESGRRSSRGPNGGPESEAGTYDTRRNAISSWLRDIASIKRSATSTSYDGMHRGSGTGYASTPVSPEMEQLHGGVPRSVATSSPAVEAPNTYIAEMMADTCHPKAELSADLVTAKSDRVLHSEKHLSSAELDSNSSGSASLKKAAPVSGAGAIARPDSPPLGAGIVGVVLPPEPSSRQLSQPPSTPIGRAMTASPATPSGSSSGHRDHDSGVSELSEADRRHLRQDSEGGQSVASGVSMISPAMPQQQAVTLLSAVLGPSASVSTGRPHPIQEVAAAEEAAESEALVGRRRDSPTSASSHRRSIFRENREDMNE